MPIVLLSSGSVKLKLFTNFRCVKIKIGGKNTNNLILIYFL